MIDRRPSPEDIQSGTAKDRTCPSISTTFAQALARRPTLAVSFFLVILIPIIGLLLNPFNFQNRYRLSLFSQHQDPISIQKPPEMPAQNVTKTATVIFCHGLGDTSAGWSFLAQQFGAQMPWVKWIFPDAPIQPVTINMGMKMPSWFDIVDLTPTAKEDEKGLLASVETIRSLIQKEVDAGRPTDRIIVGGFSQGATISILTGLMSPTLLAGVACLSGFLPLKDKIKQLEGPHASQLKVFWGHGTDDPVVKYDWGSQSVNFLRGDLGLSHVDFKSYQGLVHSASPQELADLLTWLNDCIPNQP
ncbi:hypothetical protein O181_064942 [Austropuccinia psidii MF-1]|uniref:Acyl-protein thioesterase 1 n=1 Tax=Austropuccinia psidii MF-1 TaxID=1389203 RepID=A0A9Q3EWL7_9BASI|nr:hypothetical protein [Austropuccinia psidii MF-1]